MNFPLSILFPNASLPHHLAQLKDLKTYDFAFRVGVSFYYYSKLKKDESDVLYIE